MEDTLFWNRLQFAFTILRVLISESSLYAAQDALAQSDQTVSINLVQLYKALGGGWQNETNSTPSMAGNR